MTEESKKLSHVEDVKKQSIYLMGNLQEELQAPGGQVSDDAYELLKHHGTYFGYDRDSATERKKQGLEKLWEFMVRMKAPGGRITAEQYLGLDAISDKYANGTLRITTRETFQFHCIVKDNLKNHIAAINELFLTTLGGCGDVVRNISCPSAPYKDNLHVQILEDVYKVNDFTMPKTSSYHEIWLDGENVARNSGNSNYEPLYGETYLPRKFKIALTHPNDNTMDALTHDLAFVAIADSNGNVLGYNVYVGGGLGMTHNKAETYPRLASAVAYVERDNLLKATEAVIKLQRDYGDRSNRKRARLKYVVDDKGIDWIKENLNSYYGSKMHEPKQIDKFVVPDYMGWHEQGDGKLFLGLVIASGRIVDKGEEKIRTGLYKVIEKYKPGVILTADQNIILSDIDPAQKAEIEQLLKSHGIKLRSEVSDIFRNTLACVALPTCGKALAEAERVMIPIVQDFETLLNKYSLDKAKIALRISGCPNGCSRPYVGDISLVGRMPGHYALFIGGDFEGTRLSVKILDRLPYENIAEIFDILFAEYAANKSAAEGFGDYANRVGEQKLHAILVEKLGQKYKWVA